MTKEAQESLLAEIDDIKAYGATNLWAGLRQGYKMLTSAATRLTEGLPDYFLPAVYLLTDGLPNVMAPPEGYVPALRRLMKSGPNQAKNPVVPTIHTFGFGYELRSGLLQSLAEVGGGYYAFIPDGSFVGQCFQPLSPHFGGKSTAISSGSACLFRSTYRELL
ncbi:hypothetical protein MPH_03704 [Macrophomina phaseolina MS6]|uniref:von Willebrand factor type A n=1 Tax=Macrophomina phaseolina (strain MS6) TaxID=1126212 RepID=K2S9D7_MACPH|nr:hypothetical protein MPH_03704 [Macrophomina phaseolina MS6]